MKFISLLKKEIKELLTAQVILSLFIPLILFYAIGDVMGDVVEDIIISGTNVTICNQDDSDFTKSVINAIENEGNKVRLVTLKSDDYTAELKRLELEELIVIPNGFSNTVLNDKKIADIRYISTMDSLAVVSTASQSGSKNGIYIIENAVKATLMQEKFSVEETALIDNPINLLETTIVGEKSADISSDELSGFASLQGMFVPIIIFVLLMLSSQMIIAAISTEKIDKTLETLLSAPVSRLSVLAAKMTAAALIAGLNAVVYMFGFSNLMGGITGGATEGTDATKNAVAELGMKLQGMDYVMLGAQMFLTLLIALSISLILGALAKDVKSAQALVMPIMFLGMIPYMLTMFVDIGTLSPVIRAIVYAIPFTHTFIAIDNIIFDKNMLFWGGLIYQIIALAVCMFFAVRVFMTDKIFTITLSFGQKRKGGTKKGLLQNLIGKK